MRHNHVQLSYVALPGSGGSRPGVWRGQSNWGAPSRSKYQSGSATIVECHTKVVNFGRQKVAIFVGLTMRFFREKPQFERVLYY